MMKTRPSVLGSLHSLVQRSPLYTHFISCSKHGDTVFGIWSGISLHEIAQVVLAAGIGGDDAMAFALLAKLGRVFLLIPVSFIIFYFVQKNLQQSGGKQKSIFRISYLDS